MKNFNSQDGISQLFKVKLAYLSKVLLLALGLFVLQPAISAQSLETRVSLNLSKSTVKNVLKKIESQSGYSFVYNDSAADFNRVVDVSVTNENLESVLSTILPEFTYKQENKKIILIPIKNAGTNDLASVKQAISLRGSVKDKDGEPVIGANVIVVGKTGIGTVTNIDGNFTLNNVEKGAKIEVRFLGFSSQIITAETDKFYTIVMTDDVTALNEVVFIGYGVQKKANLSGAVDGVNQMVLKDRPVTSVGAALQGAIGNLNVTPVSGQANTNPELNVRGMTSINGGGPLIVIDGVAVSNQELNNLNTADIESMSVLKDAASAAIYGSRAGFGVILVNTKKGAGAKDKIKVNYNNNVSFKQLTRKPDIITDPAIVADMKNVYSYPWYNLYDENEIDYAKKRSADPSLPPVYVNEKGEWKYFGNTNWFEEAYKNTSSAHTHSLDVSGATDILSYYFSGNYVRQDGMLKQENDTYNRYNLRSRLDFKITDWWSIGNNTSYTTSDYDAPTYLGDDYYWAVARKNPLTVPRNPDGTWTEDGATLLGIMKEGGRKNTQHSTLNTQFTTQLNLFKDIWTVNGSFSLSRNEVNFESATLPSGYRNGPEMPMMYKNEVTSAREYKEHYDKLIFDVYSTAKKTFGEKHFVSGMVGFNQEEYKYNYFNASRNNLITGNLPHVNLATGDMTVNGKREQYALRGLFFRVNYIYDDKYIFETNGRYDGSSRFPKDDRFVFNPSASLAWVVSRESFFKPLLPVVSFLKLRGSYGSLGNQEVGAYSYIASMEAAKISQILDGTQPLGVFAPGLVSSTLTWEKVQTLNFGLDANFLANRLTFAGDIYRRDTKDMLTGGQVLPNVLGTSVPKENAGDLRTTGWEITLTWRDEFKLAGKPFNYNASFILADNKSKITKFANPTGSLSGNRVGKRIGEIWGLTTLGYFTSMDDIKNHADQITVTGYPGTFDLAPGDIKFMDRNGDGKIDWGKWTVDDHGDYEIIGNSEPRYMFSFSTGAEWNNFDFSIFFQGVGKKDYYPGSSDLIFWGVQSQPWTNINKKNLDYWTEDNPNAYFPRRKAYVAEQTDRELGAPQTKYLQNAAYVRLKNLTVGYTLPSAWTRKAHISRLRVYFSGENLAEISGLDSHYKADPEGLKVRIYPFQRSYSFGINLSF